MKISENFELKEFTRSNTATQKGIANDPAGSESDREPGSKPVATSPGEVRKADGYQ